VRARLRRLAALAASAAALAVSAASCYFDASSPYRSSAFYVDPAAAPGGDGSEAAPWSDLQSVLDDLVETTAYESYPYYDSPGMVVVNKGAPIKPGDSIVLADGDYGPLIIQEKRNLREIAIRAAEGARPRFSGIHVRSSSRWRLSGLVVDGPTYESPNSSRTMLFIESHGWRGPSSDIVVEGCELSSGSGLDPRALSSAQWNGLAWTGIGASGDRLTISGNRLATVDFGISVTGNGCIVRDNVIDGFCGDAMRGLGDDLLFEYNTVKNCYVVNGNHCDGFQSWADMDTGDPPERVTLRGNRIFQWTGARPALSEYLQGIGLFDGPYVKWRIESNLVVTDMYHGISLYGGVDCEIVNNTVADEEAGNGTAPWIMITDLKSGKPSSRCLIRNNIAPSISAGEGAASDHNYAARTDEYASLFASPSGMDFRLLPGSALVDSGWYERAPALDIDRVLRPRGAGYDLGAFER
jgi:hypothetical protein